MPNEVQVSIGAKLTGAFKRVFKEAAGSVTALERKLAKLEAASAAANKLSNLQRVTKKLKSEFNKTGRTSTELKNKLNKSAAAMGKAHLEAKRLGIDTSKLSMENKRLSESLRRVRTEQEKLTRSRKKADSLRSFSGKAAAVGAASLAAGAAGVAIGRSVLQPSLDLEKTLSTVRAADQSIDLAKLDQLRKQSVKLGSTTQFTAVQASHAVLALVKAGLSADKTIASLPGVLDFATAGELELGQAAQIAANAMSQFGLEAQESARVGDVFSLAANKSTIDVQDLVESMKFLGPAASAVGASIEEASAFVAVLGNQGFRGGIATRALSSAMIKLAKPTPQMTEALKKAEVQVFDTSGAFVGLTEVFAQLEEGLLGATEQEKLNILGSIFGGESAKQALSLLNAGTTEIRSMTRSLEGAKGSAAKFAKIKLDNLAGDFVILSSAIEGMFTRIGAGATTFLRPITKALTGLVNKINDILDAAPFLQQLIAGIGLVFISLAVPIGVIALGMAGFTFAMATFVEVAATVGPIIAGIVAGVTSLGLGLIPIVGGLFLLWKFIKPISALLGGLISGFLEGISPVLKSIGIDLGEVADFFKDLLSPMSMSEEQLKSFANAGKFVGKVVGNLITLMAKLFNLIDTISFKDILGVFLGKKPTDVVADYKSAVKNSALPKRSVGGDENFTALRPDQFPRAAAPSNTTNNTVSPSIVVNAAPGMDESLLASLVAKEFENISFSSAVQERGEF